MQTDRSHLTPADPRFRMIPLGGFGEIGMNCLALETAGRILLVDCGILFPTEPTLGVERIHPSFEWLLAHRNHIEGIVITHGHEDHLGALPMLLNEISAPVYSGAYTGSLIHARLAETHKTIQTPLVTLMPNHPLSIGPFRVTAIPLPHSFPENFGLFIETEHLRLFHTGDFRLDIFSPGVTDTLRSRLSSLRPIDILITDSTGIFDINPPNTEDSVAKTIGQIVGDVTDRVFVTLFGSNICRMAHLAAIARTTGRKLVLSGRAMNRHAVLAQQHGLLTPLDDVVITEAMGASDGAKNLLVLLSGTQAEPRSAFGRLVAGRHSGFTLTPEDTIILSCRIIPGNEIRVMEAINRLLQQGITVIHPENMPGIHVSGHGSRAEIQQMMETLSPEMLIPAHGTMAHLLEVAKLAQTAVGCPARVLRNGQIGDWDATDGFQTTEVVPYGRIFLEKEQVITEDLRRQRRQLGTRGLVHVTVVTEAIRSGEPPVVDVCCRGVCDETMKNTLEEHLRQRILDSLASAPRNIIPDPQKTEEIRIALCRAVRQLTGLNPMVSIRIQ